MNRRLLVRRRGSSIHTAEATSSSVEWYHLVWTRVEGISLFILLKMSFQCLFQLCNNAFQRGTALKYQLNRSLTC